MGLSKFLDLIGVTYLAIFSLFQATLKAQKLGNTTKQTIQIEAIHMRLINTILQKK